MSNSIKSVLTGKKKIGLVVQPGGMRAAYAAGFCSALSSVNSGSMPVNISTIYGTSVAAVIGVYASAGMEDSLKRYFVDLVHSRGIFVPKRFWRQVNAKIMREVLANEIPLSESDFPLRPEVVIPLLNVKTRETEYLKASSVGSHNIPQLLTAAQAFPIVNGSRVKLNGSTYVDGGITDTMPVIYASEQDHDALVVLLSRPTGHRRHRSSLPHRLIKKALSLRTSPYVASLMGEQDDLYNQTMELLSSEKKINGKDIVLIEDTNKVHQIKWTDSRTANIEDLWNDGYEHGKQFTRYLT